MPEISEVTLTTQVLNKFLKHRKLISFDFVAGRFQKKHPPGFNEFNEALPLKVKKISSKGKLIWFDLINPKNENDHWYVINHLKLTGMWSFFEANYTKAILSFDKDITVYFSDLRNFGTFQFTNNKKDLEEKLNEIGPDFLKEDVDMSKVKKYKTPIVKILMDQKKVGSGLGNYLTAEILYRAKISPHRPGSSLTDEEIKELEYWTKYTVKLSYVNNHIGYMVNLKEEANKIKRKNYHPEIKLDEDEFKFLVYRQKKDPHGNKVKAEEIIKGRTTYWVPKVQQ